MTMLSHSANGQADLFGQPRLPGLRQAENFITPEQERALIAQIDAVDLIPFRFQQWTGKRLTHSFGWSYDFQTGAFAPTEPIPNWLQPVKARAARFAGIEPADLVQALVIRYGAGAGIGWHRDRPVFDMWSAYLSANRPHCDFGGDWEPSSRERQHHWCRVEFTI